MAPTKSTYRGGGVAPWDKTCKFLAVKYADCRTWNNAARRVHDKKVVVSTDSTCTTIFIRRTCPIYRYTNTYLKSPEVTSPSCR